MANETATLAGYVANLKFEDIPPAVLERAKVLTLDFLGSAIRARRDAESTPSLLKMLEALALDGKGDSTVFGDSKTWTPAVAALLNGALGHSLDFDDTHADSSLHPSAPVVPAAFAVGEMVGASDLFWFVKPESSVQSVKDFNGKTLAYSVAGSSSHAGAGIPCRTSRRTRSTWSPCPPATTSAPPSQSRNTASRQLQEGAGAPSPAGGGAAPSSGGTSTILTRTSATGGPASGATGHIGGAGAASGTGGVVAVAGAGSAHGQ